MTFLLSNYSYLPHGYTTSLFDNPWSRNDFPMIHPSLKNYPKNILLNRCRTEFVNFFLTPRRRFRFTSFVTILHINTIWEHTRDSLILLLETTRNKEEGRVNPSETRLLAVAVSASALVAALITGLGLAIEINDIGSYFMRGWVYW